MPQPTKAEIATKMRRRYGNRVTSTHTGGSKNHMRRRKFRGSTRASNDFEKRLQSSLQKLGCNTIPGIDEVNLFKDDGTVIHFTKPKVDAEVQSNTFIVSGTFSHSKIEDLLPGILPQMGADSLAKLKDYASSLSALNPKDLDMDDEVPMLVGEDMNFEQVAESDEKKQHLTTDTKDDMDSEIKNEQEFDIEAINKFIAESKSEQLIKNLEIFDNNQRKAIQILLKCNQQVIFEQWPEPGTDDNEKKTLLAQVLQLNTQYGPGLETYYNTGVRLITDSFERKNVYSNWVPSVPDSVKLAFNSKEFHEFEAIGKTQYQFTAFVIVAGGLGERLGYNGIKLSLPVDITSSQCFLEYYIKFILAMQSSAQNENSESNIVLPLAIMTSNDTHSQTVQLLADNNNFGMAADQIRLVKQELVPAFANNKCEFAFDSKYQLSEKPHGHGDVHTLLYKDSVVTEWSQKYSTKWLVFLQDTNGLAVRNIASALGVSSKNNFAMNSVAVPRMPGENIGALAKLTSVDNSNQMTVNVEYNQLAPLLLNNGDKKGDVADETGFSAYPGNVNTLVIRVDTYVDAMNKCRGIVPEFVNPKYTDDTRETFKKPTRLECMMQEYPKLLDSSANVGITCYPKWFAAQPVKSNINDSIEKIAKIGVAFSASLGEAAIYYLNREILRSNNPEICTEGDKKVFAGIAVAYGARVALSPSFGTTIGDIQSKLKGDITISERSSLILDGDNITINGLKLDGTLVVRVVNGSGVVINNLSVENQGWEFEDVDIEDQNIEQTYRIRGYQLKQNGARVIEFDDGEIHTIGE